MNQVERQARRARGDRVWNNVLKSWVIVGVAAFLAGAAVGVALVGRTAAEDMSLPSRPTAHATTEAAQVAAEKPKFVAVRRETVPLDESFQRYIYDVSVGYGLDWTLVLAVMAQESRFDAAAVSSSGDVGLMQINHINHPRLSEVLGITNFSDPYQNVRAGAFMLGELYRKYGERDRVLMAYHMGEGAAASLWAQGIHETGYTRSVVRHQNEIRAMWDAVPV